jgi:hypothetical protein
MEQGLMGCTSPAYAHSWQKCTEIGITVSRDLRYGSHLSYRNKTAEQSVEGIVLGFISPRTFTSPGQLHRDLVETYAPRRFSPSEIDILSGWSCVLASKNFDLHVVDLDGSEMLSGGSDDEALKDQADTQCLCFPRTDGRLREGDRVASEFEVEGTGRLYFGTVIFSLNQPPFDDHRFQGKREGVVIAFNDGERVYFAPKDMHLLFRLKPAMDSIHVLTVDGSGAVGWIQNNICTRTSDFIIASYMHAFP